MATPVSDDHCLENPNLWGFGVTKIGTDEADMQRYEEKLLTSQAFVDSRVDSFYERRSFSSENQAEAKRDHVLSGDEYAETGICQFYEEMIDIEHELGFGDEASVDGERDNPEFFGREGGRIENEEQSHQNLYMVKECQTYVRGFDSESVYQPPYERYVEEAGGLDYTNNQGRDPFDGNLRRVPLASSTEQQRLPSDSWRGESVKEQLVTKKKDRRTRRRLMGGNSCDSAAKVRKNRDHGTQVMMDALSELRLQKRLEEERDSLKVTVPNGGELLTSEARGNSYKFMVMAFEELVREFEVKEERNRKKLDVVMKAKEDEVKVMQQERRAWTVAENQLRSRISHLEMQHSRLSGMLKETTAALSLEKEKRRESRVEIDNLMETLIKEKKLSCETGEKFSLILDFFVSLKSALVARKLKADDAGRLQCVEALQKIFDDIHTKIDFSRPNHNLGVSKRADSAIQVEFDLLKRQRDMAELEKDQVEEKLRVLLRESMEGHKDMESLWSEREMLLEQNVAFLEAELHCAHSKIKRKEAEILIERQRWSDELDKCTEAWERERATWEAVWKDNTVSVMTDGDEGEGRDELEAANDNSDLTEGRQLLEGMEFVSDAVVRESERAVKINGGNILEMQQRHTEELKLAAEEYKLKKEETEERLSDALTLLANLEEAMRTKEASMVEEKSRLEGLLVTKAEEVDRLKQSLKAKERELEVTVQKFTDELKLIDKEVERERKEREQVMELHFSARRQLVCDMRSKEENWEKDLEAKNSVLQRLEARVKLKEEEILELHRKLENEQLLQEKAVLELKEEKTVTRRHVDEVLADVWQLCKEEGTQDVIAKKLIPGGDFSVGRPMWETLWREYCRSRETSEDLKASPSTLEWDFARSKFAGFEKQITDAITAINDLRLDVKSKEEQLVKGKDDKEREWEQKEKDWSSERDRLLVLVNNLLPKDVRQSADAANTHLKTFQNIESSFWKGEEEKLGLLLLSHEELAREPQLGLKHSNSAPPLQVKFPSGNSSPGDVTLQYCENSEEMCHLRGRPLDEMDRYLSDLERGKEPGVQTLSSGVTQSNSNILQRENELTTSGTLEGDFNVLLGLQEGARLSPRLSREWKPYPVRRAMSFGRGPQRSLIKHFEKGMCLTLNGLQTSSHDVTWAEEGLPIWQPDPCSRRFDSSKSLSDASSTVVGDDVLSYPTSPARGCASLVQAPATPGRRSQKWLVDVNWLDRVRKEHAQLRQQLDAERQRVAALARVSYEVEADNRWTHGALARALELKLQSDTKVADMQRKLAALETFLTEKTNRTSGSE